MEDQDCKAGGGKSSEISHAESELLNFAVLFKAFSEVRLWLLYSVFLYKVQK